MRLRILLGVLLVAACPVPSRATIFGVVRGIVHDPQHRPVPDARVVLKAQDSAWTQDQKTDQNGEFAFAAVPLGRYLVTVTGKGFNEERQEVVVQPDTAPILHIQLTLAGLYQSTVVSAEPQPASLESVTPTTLVDREQVGNTPGADRTNSLAMITDYVPGSYLTHDQLHVRGGHQVSWLIDGVPIPNTNIASNLGPQIDPKDIDYLEVLRGSYDAQYGDRAYGVFNVVPQSGFERAADGELVVSYGSFFQTNDAVKFGGHTSRFAYFASLDGNRSNLGLETPVGRVLHDAENGFGGFGSLIFNADQRNQLRFVGSTRRDYYQIPNTFDQQAAGVADGQHEGDSYTLFTWEHTFGATTVLTVSPFYHYNSADFAGGPRDFPISAAADHASQYGGGELTLSAIFRKNSAQIGFYGFGQSDDQLFGLIFNDGSLPNFRDRERASGGLESLFLEDRIQVAPWLSLSGGVRQTRFSGGLVENAITPRAGIALRLPGLGWFVRAFYGQYYQAPPLLTASGPLLAFVTNQNLGFIPLHGERDEEAQVGVTIPVRGWLLDADTFRTDARNFFDHNSVGNSDIFFPLTIAGARIRAWELTLRSPELWRRARIHLAYSNQIAEGEGAVTGGLTDFSPPARGFFLLDHDQRDTLNAGFVSNLPWHVFVSGNVYYGSGFSNGSPPPGHLPGHTTVDLSLGKSIGESLSLSVSALNAANRHLLIDNSATFGGTHFNDPRQFIVELRYRFKY